MFECPTARCDRPVPHGKPMCARCWEAVPDDLRAEFLDALNAYKRSRSARDAPRLAAARKAAIESVNPRRNPQCQ